ncbi:sugar-binding domain-containing protein [Metabacillus arenae]|uniref:sugar-binding domain-containing protein n=1 Tax=Metabacillus arenae TaxID=2771434 RepID=UPI0021E4B54E|nr:sugar-binding domain-containing protein [Metabacillus arenae]
MGDISSRFVDINGQSVNHNINEKVVGITLEELKEIQFVVGVAEGLNKLESILGALQGHYIDGLIIDEATAAAILEKL